MSRSVFDPQAMARVAERHGLVVLAGAGLSMGPPSSLPGWNAINDAFLENLALRIAEHTEGNAGYDILEFVLNQRDKAATIQPDLQAQLAEEVIGEAYFSLFKPLDISTWNAGHAALAGLARTGRLRAIVTTNFDRLIEQALAANGVKTVVYAAPTDFSTLGNHRPADGIPLIKVHGSIAKPGSMVDTLRQRVVGRPEELEAALQSLFARHAVLVVGFSGADLAYDPKYLALHAGALASPAFVFINRPGSEPHPAVTELLEAAPNSLPTDGALPECLSDLAIALGYQGTLAAPSWDPEMDFPGIRKASLPSATHSAWGKMLSPVQASVVLARIAEAAGSTDAAFQLLTRTMPYHLKAGLATDRAMPRQLGMIASFLIEACHVSSELSTDRFAGELSALQVLSVSGVRLNTESLALLSLANALVGHAVESDASGLQALRESREARSPIVRADTICTLARTWAVAEKWEPPYLQALRHTFQLMRDWGDEPRKARVGALLCRFLIETGALTEAEAVLDESFAVVERLTLVDVGNDLVAMSGRLYLAEGRFPEALRSLRSASANYDSSMKYLRLAETLLALTEAAAGAGDVDEARTAVQTFEQLLPLVPGLALPQAATRVRLLRRTGAVPEARAVVADLRELGVRWGGHPWITTLANRLDSVVDPRS